MSFGGFGSNNTSTGFGGFGSNNNTNTTSSGSLFGGGTSTSGTGFGGGGGFGSNNTSNPFGAKPTGFGSTATTSSGSMFGANTSTSGTFGSGGSGFGSNNNASTGFGASNNTSTGGGLFGQNKPATTGFGGGGSLFGSSNTNTGFGSSTTQSNPFGGGSNTTNTGFGSGNTTGNTGFGASNTGGSGFGGFGSNAGAASTAGNNNQGTSVTPFTAFTEKDGQGSTASNVAYQSITFQQPYQTKSFEELRLEDYMQNRRYPQSGSFGGSTSTFGGFGQQNNTGSSLFGANNTSTGSGFGASNTNTGFGSNTNTGFGGSNTGGGLFGQNKPAGGSLFGNNAASSGTTTTGFGATAPSGGNLFGNNNQSTGTGFGGGNSTFGSNNNNTGGSLFGGANQTQNKPAFGGFGGQNNTNTTGGTGFGGFGNNNQQQQGQQQGSSLFGGSNNTAGGGFGSNNTGGSLFGNNQAKPAGGSLFGNSTTGTNNTSTGGLFGNNNNTQQQQGGSLFGGSTNNNTGGSLFGGNNQSNTGGSSLFGNNQNKPAGGGLFGASTTGTNTGGSLFGNNQQQSNTGGSLFGGNNQNQQNTGGSLFGNNQNKPAGGLFGNTGTGNTGGSLFGNTQNNNNSGSLFGGNNANQNQSGGSSLFGGNSQNAGSSLFGGSQQNQQQPNTLQATLTGDPYGNAQLFSSLAAPSPPVGPLVTPLSNTKPPPRPRASLLASVRGTSSLIGSPGHTPRPTRPGYGFSYSTYNSPVNGAQSLTPGAAGLLRPTGSLNSSMAGRLSKSFSTSNLRGDGPEGQSLLRTPVAGQSPLLLGGGSLGSGSARKLRIDRSVRNDLFGEPPKQKQVEAAKDQDQGMRKRVSFDNNTQDATSTPSASNAVVVRDNDEDQTPRATPEAPRVNGLSSVPEDSVPQQSSATASPKSRKPVEPGEYYSKPNINQLKDMSRQERSRVTDFIVGRHNVGWIVFGKGKPVDLTQVSLDDIQGGIVQLNLRSATVYQDDANKPAVGQGLNVPSTIFLEQSWPRSSRVSGVTPQAGTMAAKKEIEAHKRRLRKVGGTDFKDYNPDTGLWSFTVEHFTTYELDDDDDDDDEEDMDEDTGMLDLQPKVPSSMRTASSALSEPPATGASAQRSMDMVQSEVDSPDLGEQDDTFEFKLAKRSQQSNISVPGGFGGETMGNVSYDYDDPSADEMQEELDVSDNQGDESMEDPFIEAGGAVQAVSPGAIEQYHSSILEDEVDEAEQGVPGSFRAEPAPPKSILKPTPALAYASPEKVAELPWEDQLQRTLSPKKRDRQALRDMQGSLARAMPDVTAEESPFKKTLFSRSQLGQSYLATKSAKKSVGTSTLGGNNDLGKSQAFTTGMDLINSLWGQPQKGASKAKGAFSEIPYPSKRPHLSDADMNEQDARFHESFKPSFDNRNTLVYSVPGSAPHVSDGMGQSIRSLVAEGKDVRFAKFDRPVDFDSPALDLLNQYTQLEVSEEPESVPRAVTSEEVHFVGFAQLPYDQTTASGKQERAIWSLCSILFDPLEACAQQFIEGMTDEQVIEYEPRIRDDLFLEFWSELIAPIVETQMKKTRSAEEKAVLLLTKGDVVGASQTLMEAGNVRLATVISQLPCNETSREIVNSQLRMWRDRKDWSEFSDAHKALYSILAGEVCTVAGVTGAPEDRTQQFCISERFGLDWKQALALQVQFGGHESLVDAVRAFVAEVQEGNEKVDTRASHMQGDGEDTLLGLLKLEALQGGNVEEVFDPATVSGSALNSRVAWQLANLLTTTQICELAEEKLDQLAVDFVMQLEAAGDWIKAAWTLLHVTDAEARTNAITGLLERNAAHLPAPNQDEAMMDDSAAWTPAGLQLPASLIWSAKALYAAAVLHEPALQADYLLNTGLDSAFIEAHDVLCRTVGPAAIIEQDYSDLTALLEHFSAVGAEDFEEWKLGGNVYALFLRLISLSPGRKEGREGKLACTALKKELQQLEQAELDAQGISLEMRVARMEMRRVLKETMREIGLESKRGFEGGEARKGKVEDMLVDYRRALGVVA